MSANLPLAISHRRTRFILVNDRLPHTDERCATCGGILEKGYAVDLLRRAVLRGRRLFVR
jgi:hypothetical protein